MEYIIFRGNLIDGFKAYGPFLSLEDAEDASRPEDLIVIPSLSHSEGFSSIANDNSPNKDRESLFVNLTGNPSSGFNVYGPFASFEKAMAASLTIKERDLSSTIIMPLESKDCLFNKCQICGHYIKTKNCNNCNLNKSQNNICYYS